MKDEVKQQLNSLAMLKSFCFTLRKTVFFSISHMEAPFTWKRHSHGSAIHMEDTIKNQKKNGNHAENQKHF